MTTKKRWLLCRPKIPVLFIGHFNIIFLLWPYLPENTGSRLISKVKLARAQLVLWLVTTWESLGAVVFLTLFISPFAILSVECLLVLFNSFHLPY